MGATTYFLFSKLTSDLDILNFHNTPIPEIMRLETLIWLVAAVLILALYGTARDPEDEIEGDEEKEWRNEDGLSREELDQINRRKLKEVKKAIRNMQENKETFKKSEYEALRRVQKSLEKYQGVEFKSVRLQLVYKKALRTYPDDTRKMKLLKQELKELDKMEEKLRKLRHAGVENDGELEKTFSTKLKHILHRYGLEVAQMARQSMDNFGLKDPRLLELWDKIYKLNIKHKDLEIFKEELVHFQQRIDEYNSIIRSDPILELMESLDDDYKIEMRTSAEAVQNISQMAALLNDYPDMTLEELDERRLEFLKLRHEIGYGMSKWLILTDESKMTNGNKPPEFHEPVVARFYEMAQNSNFTEDELFLLTQDLRHVQAKIKKQDHYDHKASQLETRLKQDESQAERTKAKEHVSWLNQKSEDLRQHIGKMLASVQNRIHSRPLKSEL